ncbi:MAG: tannase/feruloyl esterase family alpha/beta hydrolase [Myxococcales bacterium]
MTKTIFIALLLGGVELSASCGSSGHAPPGTVAACDDGLKSVDLGSGATVTLVKAFKKGDAMSLVSPAPAGAVSAQADVCLVKLIVGPGSPGPVGAPSTSAGIGVEVLLPAAVAWNERYQAFGGAGLLGGPDITSLTAIGFSRMHPDAVSSAMNGFVVSITDGGHSVGMNQGLFFVNPDGTFNETLYRDSKERAAHEMVLKSKALIHAFYGKQAKFSYWNGCSAGGSQALTEVERYAEDFDGVLAGAPAIDRDKAAASLWPQVVMQQDLGQPIARAKLEAVTAAAIAACGPALTGQADGYVSDPSECRYDPTLDHALLCAADGGSNQTAVCLTEAEAAAINKIWYGPTIDGKVPSPAADNGYDSRGALAPNQLWFGLSRGTRLAGHPYWDGLAGAAPPMMGLMGFIAVALGDPSFAAPGSEKWKTIGYTGPISFANVFAAFASFFGNVSTTDADVHAFRDRGGKLLIWHGTGDSLIFPPGTVRYYEAMSALVGGYVEARKFARLYLAPGIDHCFFASVSGTNPPAPGGHLGDPDTPNVGLMDVLQRWVENDEEPEQITATSAPGVSPTRTRPWCPYPKKLHYGGGDVNTGPFSCE